MYAGWGFSQQYYREKLHETVLGFKDLEDFMVNFWEAWALSKGKSIGFSSSHRKKMRKKEGESERSTYLMLLPFPNQDNSLTRDETRSRKHAHHAPHMANRRRIAAGTLQRGLQRRHERHQSENIGVAVQDGFVFP